MQDHYEFNVSLGGKHLFATHERSCTDFDKLEALWKILHEKFQKKDGYEVTCTRWEAHGSKVLTTRRFY